MPELPESGCQPETPVFLKLRDDLLFTPLPSGSGSWSCQIEDLSRSKFFHVGVAEYTFLSLLDGKTTVRKACLLAQETEEAASISEQNAADIAKWLLHTGLATASSERGLSLDQQRGSSSSNTSEQSGNPLFFRVPIGSPDRVIRCILPFLRWIYGPIGFVIWAVLLAAGGYSLCTNWTQFSNESIGVLATDNWPWLVGIWLALKLIHELSHATACRTLGGRVGTMGVLMVLLAPLAYVDVTSSWRFPSRWQRILVAFAGMYAELAIAALAAIMWANVDGEILKHRLYNVILIGGVSTLFFNANPLVRADGYYILTDLCGLPNLQKIALKELRGLFSLVLGASGAASPYSVGARLRLSFFGLVICCWRLFVYTCFVLATASFFHGSGIVLIAGIVLFVAFSTIVRMRNASRPQPGKSIARRFTRLATIASFVLLLSFVLLSLSWKAKCSAPGIVRHAPHATVRAQIDGFLTKLSATNNDVVKKGDLLATVSNDELTATHETLRKEVEMAALNCQLLLRQQKTAEYRVEQERLAGLRNQLKEKSLEVARLAIYAPIAGRIVGRKLESRLQTYLKEGDALFAIEGNNTLELLISVSQRDVGSLSPMKGNSVPVRIAGVGRIQGHLSRLAPKGSDALTLTELSAVNGGPLPVTEHAESEIRTSAEKFRLLEPRFEAVVVLDTPPQGLRSGQMGTAYWEGTTTNGGKRISRAVRDWFRERTRKR